MIITKGNVLFCRKMTAKYLAHAAELDSLATDCAPAQKGAYRSQAVQARKNADRMQKNEQFQMDWLKKRNHALWLELQGDQ